HPSDWTYRSAVVPRCLSCYSPFFSLNAPASSALYTLSLHDALPIFILEYRQTKWSRGFSHRSESRIEISTELDDDVGRLSDSGGRKAAQRSGSVRSIPDSSS